MVQNVLYENWYNHNLFLFKDVYHDREELVVSVTLLFVINGHSSS